MIATWEGGLVSVIALRMEWRTVVDTVAQEVDGAVSSC